MGKPTMLCIVSVSEYIAYAKVTQRTETSKYLKEEKENSIPLVAASETGSAQTRRLAFWGCRTLYTELQRNELSEAAWKGPPKKVTVL